MTPLEAGNVLSKLYVASRSKIIKQPTQNRCLLIIISQSSSKLDDNFIINKNK